jgi:tetratricopeptide (TPR) repeat protein
MSPNESNLLVDHLDRTLEGAELQAVEQLIRNDEQAAAEWQLLQFTVSNIREAGLYEQVRSVREEYAASNKEVVATKSTGGIVRSINQKLMRVAAVFVLVTFSVTFYKFLSVSDRGVYENYYASYELHTSRSLNVDDRLDNAYKDRKWSEVLTIVNGMPEKNNKHHFLAGMAALELKQYDPAINSFQSVLDQNRISGDDYFNEEAEYYLAMSYLANKEADKGVIILDKISKDKNHQYHQAVAKMGIDFKILRLKERK